MIEKNNEMKKDENFVSIKSKSKVGEKGKGKGKGKGNFTLTRIDDYQNKKGNIMNDGFAFLSDSD